MTEESSSASVTENSCMARPRDERREMYAQMFNLPYSLRIRNFLTQSLMDQLDRCKDDEARRVLLGRTQCKIYTNAP
jgi:hypothetical protein